MPELPEVQTIVNQLNKKVRGMTIADVWTDKKKLFRNSSFKNFKESVKNRKILKIERRGKHIIIYLDKNLIILVHLKMTGHFLFGKWEIRNKKIIPLKENPLMDDKYIHAIFYFKNGWQLAFSDLRQFGRIEVYSQKEFDKLETINELGIEPLSSSFTLKAFQKILKRRKINIKKAIMDQKSIAGIGNIYASEILFKAGISPKRSTESLLADEIKNLFSSIKFILKKGLALNGDSVSDYRQLNGEKGGYQNYAKVYRKKECPVCRKLIKYIKIDQRGTYYCPNCQK